jgi:hypothetical protein
MTDKHADDAAPLLATLDKVVAGLDDMLDELSRLVYTMARNGQRTEQPLALYRALVESVNQAKTLRAQEMEALQVDSNETYASLEGSSVERAG